MIGSNSRAPMVQQALALTPNLIPSRVIKSAQTLTLGGFNFEPAGEVDPGGSRWRTAEPDGQGSGRGGALHISVATWAAAIMSLWGTGSPARQHSGFGQWRRA